jgi:hypothetical protein
MLPAILAWLSLITNCRPNSSLAKRQAGGYNIQNLYDALSVLSATKLHHGALSVSI